MFTAAQASPPGYRPPRHFYTARHQPYRRLPLRLTLGGNLAYYNGDLTSKSRDNTYRLGLSVGVLKPLSPHLTFGADLGYIKLKARDFFPSRGLSFEGTNGLLTAFLRYSLFPDKTMYLGPNFRNTTAQIFAQAGGGLLLYNPTPRQTIGGVTYRLPDENRNAYPGLGLVLPVGGGVTVRTGKSVAFTLEGLYYFTSTDLLDGVSQRGNASSVDSFITGAFKVEVALGGHKKGKPLVHYD